MHSTGAAADFTRRHHSHCHSHGSDVSGGGSRKLSRDHCRGIHPRYRLDVSSSDTSAVAAAATAATAVPPATTAATATVATSPDVVATAIGMGMAARMTSTVAATAAAAVVKTLLAATPKTEMPTDLTAGGRLQPPGAQAPQMGHPLLRSAQPVRLGMMAGPWGPATQTSRYQSTCEHASVASRLRQQAAQHWCEVLEEAEHRPPALPCCVSGCC